MIGTPGGTTNWRGGEPNENSPLPLIPSIYSSCPSPLTLHRVTISRPPPSSEGAQTGAGMIDDRIKVFRSIFEYDQWYRSHVLPGTIIGLISTKGVIHEGHLQLVRMARQECNHVVVSIALHPGQFPTAEDFDRFPRQAAPDLEALEMTGAVDVLLLLKPDEVCRYGLIHGALIHLVSDILPPQSEYYDPGVGEGEATLLVKIMNVVKPTRLYLGRKDILRARMLQRLLDDLLYMVTVVEVPTVRDPQTGIAHDCRLHGMSGVDLQAAQVVYRALKVMVAAFLQDELRSEVLIARGRATLETEAERVQVRMIRVAHPYGFQDVQWIDPAIGAIAIIRVTIGGKGSHRTATITDNVILAPRIPGRERTLWSLVRSSGAAHPPASPGER